MKYLLFLLVIISFNCFAQPNLITGNACMARQNNVPYWINERVYVINGTDNNGTNGMLPAATATGNYSEWSINKNESQYSCYRWILVTANGCYMRRSPGVGLQLGNYGYFTGPSINCPLDDYILLLILPLGAFAFHIMRKRSLIN